MRPCLLLPPLVGVALLASLAPAAEPPIDYNRQIRPILADNCFACHGQDSKQRKKGLRLDTAKGAYGLLDAGEGHPIVPGKSDESDVIARITTDDQALVMPPKNAEKTLTK